jgi:hypothetical protein
MKADFILFCLFLLPLILCALIFYNKVLAPRNLAFLLNVSFVSGCKCFFEVVDQISDNFKG